MTLERKPDLDAVRERFRAFWQREIVDRPPVEITLAAPHPAPTPSKEFASWDERWLDVEFRVDEIATRIGNTIYLGDAVPSVYPNLGPEVYSAWCGCPLHFTETTSWTDPAIASWERDHDKVRLDMEHPLFKTLDRLTDGLIERGKGQFLVGLSDFHPGGDHLAALRDPQRLCTDLIEHPEYVKRELAACESEYFAAYNHFYQKIKATGGPMFSWMGNLMGEGRFYIPSNDFSCMISTAMFEEFFLQGIINECRFYDQSVYHLDGPGAIRHLDLLLDIPELDAVQWVCGAGNEGYLRWVDLYRRIQNAGKGVVIYPDISELPSVFETLRPEGVYFGTVTGVDSPECAETVINRIEKWA